MKKLLVVCGLALGAIALSWSLAGTHGRLAVRYELGMMLTRLQSVTPVEVEGLPPFRMFLDPADFVVSGGLKRHGAWEKTETHWFLQSVRPGDVVVDVGANIGYYTLLAAAAVGESGRVYAFEPDPTAFAFLQKNVQLNGFSNVVLEQKAVSNESGTLRLFISSENRGDHRIYQPEEEQRTSVEVEAVALDDYFSGREETVDFIKVDTQGAEAVILAGMMDLVRRTPDIVMAVEYSPLHLAGLGSTAEELLDGLEALQLRMFDLGPGWQGAVKPVRPIGRARLLRSFRPTSNLFTNLLLVKGRPDVIAALEKDASG